MKLSWYRFVRGSALTMLVLGASTSVLADDAKKQEIKLAKCAASYKTALTACENVELAVVDAGQPRNRKQRGLRLHACAAVRSVPLQRSAIGAVPHRVLPATSRPGSSTRILPCRPP